MKLKKWILSFGLITTLTAPLSVAISCTDFDPQFKNFSHMRGQGSSSVLPVMYDIQGYINDFQYEGTGSGDGLKVGTNDIKDKDFGMTSSLKHPKETSQWETTRTVTYAIDAIAIVLNLPPAIAVTFDKGERPIVIGSELGKLYDLNIDNNKEVTWDALLQGDQSKLVGGQSEVFPLGRMGGKEASGTSDGFFHKLKTVSGIADLDKNHNKLGKNHLTAEANSAALSALISKPNGLTYVSLGVALQNESKTLRVAIIQTVKNEIWIPSIANVQDTSNPNQYKWVRPFNIIYNVANEKAVSFVDFLLGKYQQMLPKLNFIELTEEQIAKQKSTISLKTPDVEIVGDVTKDVLGLDV